MFVNVRNALVLFTGIFFVDFFSKRLLYEASIASLNTGFGIFPSSPVLIAIGVLITCFFFGAAIIAAYRSRPMLGHLLIAAGAASNMADRIQFGGVIDYIPIPIFLINANLSDMIILTGLAILLSSLRNNA